MHATQAILPLDADRWRVRCPACRTVGITAARPRLRPHVCFRCPRCSTKFWGVRWWARLEAVNRWREAPGREAADHALAVLAMLGCAVEHLDAVPFDGATPLRDAFERAFELRDPAHGLALLAAFAQDMPLAPVPSTPPAAGASEASAPASELPAALTDARAHTHCPSCWEPTTVPLDEAAAGEGITECECGHRWVWNAENELAGIVERVVGAADRSIPFVNQRLRGRLENAAMPVSGLTRAFAAQAAATADLAAMNQALRLVEIELGTAE